MSVYPTPVELLQNLIRFDTTNLPGNEGPCIAYIDGLLKDAGCETMLLEKFPGRPNLISRLKGTGSAPPLLLYGHVDVVPTTGQQWTYPPFGGEIHDDFIWGRGALDMKGGVAMMVSAFLRAKRENLPLPGDVILCVVSDEERGGAAGAHFLVTEHADLFKGVRHAIGEFGGFTLSIGGQRFYAVMVGEKQLCPVQITIRGPGGHASTPLRGGATAKLARLLDALDKNRLPVHVTPAARHMLEAIAASLPAPANDLIRSLLDPAQTDAVLDKMGDLGNLFNPLLHNTAVPTIIHGGEAPNVIPALITVTLDGRLLPGFTSEDMLRELRGLLSDEVEIDAGKHDAGPGEPDMGLFGTLEGILKETDASAHVVPLLLAAVTDGRIFARIGIQTYGFLPMQLPEGFNFVQTIHAADERIPVAALDFGTNAVYKVLQRFGV